MVGSFINSTSCLRLLFVAKSNQVLEPNFGLIGGLEHNHFALHSLDYTYWRPPHTVWLMIGYPFPHVSLFFNWYWRRDVRGSSEYEELRRIINLISDFYLETATNCVICSLQAHAIPTFPAHVIPFVSK